jgi:hypothetical protein
MVSHIITNDSQIIIDASVAQLKRIVRLAAGRALAT